MFEAVTAPVRSAPDIEPAREPTAFEALVREIGEDGACEVRTVFWSDTDARLQLFRTLALEQHRAKIGREAHSLKSAARTFGYLRLAALALRLEATADVLGGAEFGELVERMDIAFAAAREQERSY
jgi:HPt (histidine-containing phosphotransfer) domain-containing protein